MMRTMIQRNLLGSGERMVASYEVFESIGCLTFEQLSTLRHRGAFSAVSQTFATCCQVAQRFLVSPELQVDNRNILLEWHKGTIDCIYRQTSTTRRSAGIPALTTGILTANAQSPSFETVLTELEEIARLPVRTTGSDGSSLPQVHALNCIRGVFRSSVLSRRAEQYFPRFLQLAASTMRSEV
jgi:hypothetical protein